MPAKVYKRLLIVLIILSSCLSVSIGQEVNRIVSLAPSLTKNLYYLELQDRLVGCTSYCIEANKQDKTVVASAIKVNIEKVVTQKPDLVIATTITNLETIQSLEKFGIKTEVFPTPKSYEEICQQFDRLAVLTGKKNLADRLLKQNNQSIDSIRNAISDKKGGKVFFQIGAKPLYTVPGNNFMDDYITYIGCINITGQLKNGNITRETVIKSNPDHIFITTMGIIAKEEKKIWESMQDMEAAKNGNIYIIDADMVCTPTPFTFKQTLDEMLRCIYDY